MITSSPFMIYVVFSSIRDILGYESGLFKRIKSYRRITHLSVAMFLVLWSWLRLTLRLSDKAFRDSELCSNTTFKDLLLDLLLLFVPPTGPAGGFWFALCVALMLSLLAVILGWCEVVVGFLTHREGEYRPWEKLPRAWGSIGDAWYVSITTST